VPKEIAHWLENRSPNTLLIVLTDGEIVWDSPSCDFDWAKTTSLPSNLRKVFKEEPLYLDFRSARTDTDLSLRNPAFLNKIARLAATLHGRNLDELIGEDVRQHRMFKIVSWTATTAIFAFALIAFWQFRVASQQRDVANERYHIALSRQLAMQALANLNGHLDLAMLLSVQAYLTYNTAEAYGSLLAALEQSPNLVTYLFRSMGDVGSIAFSPDHKTLAVANCVKEATGKSCAQANILLLNTDTYQPLGPALIAHTASLNGLAFSHSGKVLASAGEDGEILLWDLTKRQPTSELLFKYTSGLTCITFSADDKMLASGAKDGTVLLWKASARQPARRLKHSGSPVWSVAFNPASTVLASGGEDNMVIIWDPQAGTLASRFMHVDRVKTLAFYKAQRGEKILSSSLDAHTSVWDLKSGKPAYPTISTSSEYVESLKLSSDGKILAQATKDATLNLLDIEGRAALNVLPEEHDNYVGEDLRQEAVKMGELRPLYGHHYAATRLAFSDDNKLLASTERDGTIILWNTAQTSPLVQYFTINKSDQEIRSAIGKECENPNNECWQSPDRNIEARVNRIPVLCGPGLEEKACINLGIRLRDMTTGFQIGPPLLLETKGLPLLGDQQFHLSFIAEHQIRVAADEIELAYEWNIDPKILQARACSIANRNLTREEWRQHLGDEAYRKTCQNLP
jgi:WD40 repeat protein